MACASGKYCEQGLHILGVMVTRYYSQHGEDFLLSEMFKGVPTGFFVEVGCIDGRRFSNTLTFEERGWRGLCVEAHEAYIPLLKKNRPHSIVCHCAAGEKDEDRAVFYANARGSLSSLDKTMEAHFREQYRDYFTGFAEQQVKKERLNTLFERYQISHIDILSVDVEGYEMEVLKGMDFKKIRPRIMVVELDTIEHEKRVDQIVIPTGYAKSVKLGPNRFYLSDANLGKKLKRKYDRVPLIHTTHPLDVGPDQKSIVHIDLRDQNRLTLGLPAANKMMATLGNAVKGIKKKLWK